MENEKRVKLAETLVVKGRVSLVLDLPFFGVLSSKLMLKVSEQEKTMGTDGIRLFFNPLFVIDYLKKMPFIKGVIMHEVLHCVLGHVWRRGNRNPLLWNFACDYAVNLIIEEFRSDNREFEKEILLPKGCLLDYRFENMLAEKIYDFLMDKYLSDPEDWCLPAVLSGVNGLEGPIMDEGSGSNGDKSRSVANSGQGRFDSHDKWDTVNGKEDCLAEWVESTATVYERFKSCGNTPGQIVEVIDNFFKPKKDWRKILPYLVSPKPFDYGFNPPDSRFAGYPFALPDENMEDSLDNVWWFVDWSGSVPRDMLTQFYSEIKGCLDQFPVKPKLSVLGFDTEVTYYSEEFSEDAVKGTGRGGTDPRCCFEFMEENDKFADATCIIVLTDGEFRIPEKEIAQGVPVIWALSGINNGSEFDWGSVIHID